MTLPSHLVAQNWMQAVREGDTQKVREGLALGICPNGLLPVLRFTPLFSVCQDGYVSAAQVLLEHGAPVDMGQPSTNMTPLMAALEAGKKEAVELLCQSGARMDAMDHQHRTPLHWAINSRRADLVGILLENGADPNMAGENAPMPLTSAVAQRSPEIVELLLHAGARVDDPRSLRETALLVACNTGQHILAARLLHAGARIDRPDKGGMTPLMMAARMGHVGTLQVLLAAGANPNCANSRGLTALDLCFENTAGEAIAMQLLEAGVRFQRCPPHGPSALSQALRARWLTLAEWMLDRGADTEMRDEEGKTALHHAALAGFENGVRCLLKDYGAIVDARDKNGLTPLHYASTVEVVDALLEHWADPYAKDVSSQTSVARQARLGHEDIATYLYRYGTRLPNPDPGLLHEAVSGGCLEVVELLLKDGCNPNSLDQEGRHPLQIAAEKDHGDIGALLVAHGATLKDDGHDFSLLGSFTFQFKTNQAWSALQAGALEKATRSTESMTPRRRM